MKLPVYWASNKKAWMTSTLFENWYKYHFILAVKFYCKKKNLDFKILCWLTTVPPIQMYHTLMKMLGLNSYSKYNLTSPTYGSR